MNPVAAPGVLVLTSSNSYTGGTVLNDSPAVPTRGLSTIRAAANNALGTGSIDIGPQGNETQARVELIGGISIPNGILFRGRNNSSPAVENVSGVNTMTGAASITTGGGTYAIQSDAGTLNMTGTDVAASGIAITSTAAGSEPSPCKAPATATSAD
jgi:hypothetical protein